MPEDPKRVTLQDLAVHTAVLQSQIKLVSEAEHRAEALDASATQREEAVAIREREARKRLAEAEAQLRVARRRERVANGHIGQAVKQARSHAAPPTGAFPGGPVKQRLALLEAALLEVVLAPTIELQRNQLPTRSYQLQIGAELMAELRLLVRGNHT